MPAYWSLLSVTGPQFYRADSNTPRSVYFKIRQIAAVLEWRLQKDVDVRGWVDSSNDNESKHWIEGHSDHSYLIFEVQKA